MEEVLSAIAKMSTQDLVEIQVAVDKRNRDLCGYKFRTERDSKIQKLGP